MYLVDIYIKASKSNYLVKMESRDRRGVIHKRVISNNRESTIYGNTLTAFVDALKALNRPCVLNVHTDLDYVIDVIRKGWLLEWKRNGWRTTKKEAVKYREQWMQIDNLLANHSVKFIKMEE